MVIDPWAPPTAAQLEYLRARPTSRQLRPWQQPSGMSLRSVPDARSPVPLRWWVPVVAVVMLAATTVAVLPGSASRNAVLVAIMVNILGYASV